MKNIVFIAPHGTGKGTQCDLLVESFGYSHISTGNLLRDEVKSGSELGKKIHQMQTDGVLVTDDIVIPVLEKRLNEVKDKNGIIFDGYPRTLAQAIILDELMEKIKQNIDLVIYLEISKEEALKRTLGRLVCPECKRSYNKFYDYLKPQNENLCDDCNVELKGRADDTEEAFNNLFEVFLQDTKPILDYYKEKGVLKTVNASQSTDEIFNEIKMSLND